MPQPIGKSIGFVVFLFFLLFCLQCSKSKKSNEQPPPAPVLSSVSPADGIIGDPVTLQGSNLTGADNITFNGTSSKIIQNNGSTLSTVVPQGVTAGTTNIVVHTAGGASNQVAFNVLKTPDHNDSLPP